jgi:Lar family restriction alleviation protein
MTQDAKTLKPCPFCGGEGEPHENANSPDTGLHWIRCKVCGADGPSETLDAIASWNHRALRDGEATGDFAETLNFYISDSENGISRVPRQKLVEIQNELRAAALTRKSIGVDELAIALNAHYDDNDDWTTIARKVLFALSATPPVAQTGTVGTK